MNKGLALTIVGGTVALGLFFQKPLGNLVSRLYESPQEKVLREKSEARTSVIHHLDEEARKMSPEGYVVITYRNGGFDDTNVRLPPGSTIKRNELDHKEYVYNKEGKLISEIDTATIYSLYQDGSMGKPNDIHCFFEYVTKGEQR